jgi:hypothetical protein
VPHTPGQNPPLSHMSLVTLILPYTKLFTLPGFGPTCQCNTMDFTWAANSQTWKVASHLLISNGLTSVAGCVVCRVALRQSTHKTTEFQVKSIPLLKSFIKYIHFNPNDKCTDGALKSVCMCSKYSYNLWLVTSCLYWARKLWATYVACVIVWASGETSYSQFRKHHSCLTNINSVHTFTYLKIPHARIRAKNYSLYVIQTL